MISSANFINQMVTFCILQLSCPACEGGVTMAPRLTDILQTAARDSDSTLDAGCSEEGSEQWRSLVGRCRSPVARLCADLNTPPPSQAGPPKYERTKSRHQPGSPNRVTTPASRLNEKTFDRGMMALAGASLQFLTVGVLVS